MVSEAVHNHTEMCEYDAPGSLKSISRCVKNSRCSSTSIKSCAHGNSVTVPFLHTRPQTHLNGHIAQIIMPLPYGPIQPHQICIIVVDTDGKEALVFGELHPAVSQSMHAFD
jgi:hypothetical protein